MQHAAQPPTTSKLWWNCTCKACAAAECPPASARLALRAAEPTLPCWPWHHAAAARQLCTGAPQLLCNQVVAQQPVSATNPAVADQPGDTKPSALGALPHCRRSCRQRLQYHNERRRTHRRQPARPQVKQSSSRHSGDSGPDSQPTTPLGAAELQPLSFLTPADASTGEGPRSGLASWHTGCRCWQENNSVEGRCYWQSSPVLVP